MRSLAAAAGLFVLIAIAITWPQAPRLATHASDHHDVYFNMWRLAWVAHAAAAPNAGILDGNIFFPERFLYRHAPGFSSLRAPARLGVFVLFFLGVLAAFGHAALAERLSYRKSWLLAVLVWAVLLTEYWVAPLRLVPFPNHPPPLYAWLATQPRGVVAELPMPAPETLPGDDPRYVYLSTFHWMPMLNGYSGYYPRSYIRQILDLRDFRPRDSVATLRRAGVTYVIVHFPSFDPARAAASADVLLREPLVSGVGQFHDGRGTAIVFRLEAETTPGAELRR